MYRMILKSSKHFISRMAKSKSSICLTIIFLLFTAISCSHQSDDYYIQTAEIPSEHTHQQKVELSANVLPHPRQLKWFEDEFFGFIHYGPNTYTGREWGDGTESAAVFNPVNLDTDQWVRTMKEAGMKRVIMVVKHHEGYALWQTRYTDHSVASSPWRNGEGDVLRELVESVEKYGLRLGIYLSPADLYQIESPNGYYGNDSDFTEREIPAAVEGRPFEDERTFNYRVDDYNEYFLNQLFELLTEYGPIYEVWFDGANPRPGTGQAYTYEAWYDLIRELAPDAAIFGKGPDARWVGNEGGRTREAEYNVIPLDVNPDDFDWPDMTNENIAGRDMITENTRYFHYYPAETNTSIRHGWFWRNDDEQQVRSADDVFDIYERSAGGNSVFHLNIPPNPQGKFSPRDVEVLKDVGRRIDEVYGSNLMAGATTIDNRMLDNDRTTWWEAPEKQVQFEIELSATQTINRFMVREAIADRGERVENHHLEVMTEGAWKQVAEGKTIGNKRILRFPEVNTDRLRFTITQSRLEPAISHISAHYYDEPPKPVVIHTDAGGNVSLGVGTSFSWNNHGTADQSQNIYYTLDGSEPSELSEQYEEPVYLPEGGYIRARAIVGERQGQISERRLGIVNDEWKANDSGGQITEAAKAFDANPNLGWICCEDAYAPYSLTLDMQTVHDIVGFSYIPNTDGGFIESFQVEMSEDGELWERVHSGSFGNIQNDPSQRIVIFDQKVRTRYIRFSNLTPPGDEERVGAAAIEILPEVTF